MSGKWKTLGGQKVDDIVAWVRDNTRGDQVIHIGTDSLQVGKRTQFVTVVVILNPPKGGRVAYTRDSVERISSLRQRLNEEVWRSINLAMLMPNGDNDPEITIHIDANPNEKWMSSKYVQELVGLVVGQGFKHLIKPESWAATHAADHVVRLNAVDQGRMRLVSRGRRR